MPAIHIATLFLPHTATFDALEKDDDMPSAPPSPLATIKRNSSTAALISRVSSLNLLAAPSITLTPTALTEEELNSVPLNKLDSRRNSRQLTLAAEPRKLLHSDADVPEWGSTVPLYKQPRSRAGPLPSKSATDFRRLRDEAFEDFVPKAMLVLPAPSSGAGEYDKWSIVPALRGNGALLNAVQAVASANDSTEISWVGTLGFPTDALPKETAAQIDNKLANDYDSEVVYVSDEDFSGHYKNFCKIVLWPLFHYQVPDDVNSKAYMDRSWDFYYNVNLAFAEKLIKNYRKDETIWIHDYHLLLVPSMIRAQRPEAKIGFFLHVAFPSSEIFRCQMKYRALLNGMLGANLVAFQLPEYTRHFLTTCGRFLQVDATSEGIQLEDRFVNVASQPIGINPAEIEKVRQSKEFQETVLSLLQEYTGKRLIVSRDKLDRVHGVRQKLLAYERFLDRYPHQAQDTVLMQMLSPIHEASMELLGRISEIQKRISQKHGTITCHPLQVFDQNFSPAEYYAFLAVGDALMISTQRDGMNLTAHEFVFCQDGDFGKRHGTLILSEFAGAADILKDDVLRINPWNIQQQCDAIASALGMDGATKEARWKSLYGTVMRLTGQQWFEELDRTLTEAHKTQGERAAASVPRLQNSELLKTYEQADQRVFILDYEGTLIARQTSVAAILTSPYRVIEVLNDLMMDPKNVVYVMSGSSYQQLSQIFQTANGVGLIAENGCYVLSHGENYARIWETAVDESAMVKWKNEMNSTLSYWQQRLNGSVVEERDCSMEYNFAGVDKKIVERLFGDVQDNINDVCERLGVKAVRKDTDILLIEQAHVNKKTMAETVFDRLQMDCVANGSAAPDFMVVAGNDREDEVIFQWANDLGKEGVVRDVFTVSTASRDTAAKAAIAKGSAGLLSVLEKLAQSSHQDQPVKNPGKKKSARFIPTTPDKQT